MIRSYRVIKMLKIYPRRAIVPSIRLFSNFVKPDPPKFEKSGNLLVNVLNYVKKVDQYQDELEKSPNRIKVNELLDKIKDKPELLSFLSKLHKELNKVGINQEVRDVSILKYRVAYVWKLWKLHHAFWELCQTVDISSHKHKLNLNPKDIGVLDPQNFSNEDYEQLKQGVYKGVSFKHLEH